MPPAHPSARWKPTQSAHLALAGPSFEIRESVDADGAARVTLIGELDIAVADADTMLEAAIEAGADDVSSGEDGHEVICAQDSYGEVSKALEARFGEPRRTALIWKAQNTIEVDDETGEKLIRLVEVIEDQDDVQNVYVNFALSDALMAKLEG